MKERTKEKMSKEKQVADAVFGMLKAYNQTAMACLKQNKVEQAIKIFKDSLKLQEMFRVKKGIAETHHNIANAYMLLGRPAEARTHLEKSKGIFEELKSEQGLFHVNLALGQLAMHEGKEEEALGHFASCVSSDLIRSNKELLGTLYQLYLGRDQKKATEIKALLDGLR